MAGWAEVGREKRESRRSRSQEDEDEDEDEA